MNVHISLFNIDRKVKQIQVPLPPKIGKWILK